MDRIGPFKHRADLAAAEREQVQERLSDPDKVPAEMSRTLQHGLVFSCHQAKSGTKIQLAYTCSQIRRFKRTATNVSFTNLLG